MLCAGALPSVFWPRWKRTPRWGSGPEAGAVAPSARVGSAASSRAPRGPGQAVSTTQAPDHNFQSTQRKVWPLSLDSTFSLSSECVRRQSNGSSALSQYTPPRTESGWEVKRAAERCAGRQLIANDSVLD